MYIPRDKVLNDLGYKVFRFSVNKTLTERVMKFLKQQKIP